MTAEDRAAHVEREAVAGDEAWNPQAHQARLDKYGSTLDRWNVNYVAARIADYPELIEAVERIRTDAVLAALPQTGDAAAVAREALYAARDALYRGEGPDLAADSDIVYGEWLGNRADALTAGADQ